MAAEPEGSNKSTKKEAERGMPGSGSDRAWWRPPAWASSLLLHEWIRSGGILIAAAWGVYTFVWKDILVPAWQPATLSLEVSLTAVPDSPVQADGREMTLVVKAVNSSSRRVYLLANVWWLRELRRDPRTESGERRKQLFLQNSDETLRKETVQEALEHVERDVTSTYPELLAVGRLFGDDVIHPGESVNRTILVRIPNGTSAADLRITVPLLSRPPEGFFKGRRLAWGLSEDITPIPMMCSTANDKDSAQPPVCKPLDPETVKKLQQFDPKQATIKLNKQIGLSQSDTPPPTAQNKDNP